MFSVDFEDEDIVRIMAKGEGATEAHLSFEKQENQLRRIGLADSLRGEKIHREVAIDGVSPVYPSFSTVPFYFPSFSCESFCEYKLKRFLNGRPVGVEALEQRVIPVDRDALTAALPDEASLELEGVVADGEGVLFVIEKNGVEIFKQYWFPGFPWAVYTESKDCKAWMKR